MAKPTERPEPQDAPTQDPGEVSLQGDELPAVSREEAAQYIGEMAGNLGRIAAGCGLHHLAHLLRVAETEARHRAKPPDSAQRKAR